MDMDMDIKPTRDEVLYAYALERGNDSYRPVLERYLRAYPHLAGDLIGVSLSKGYCSAWESVHRCHYAGEPMPACDRRLIESALAVMRRHLHSEGANDGMGESKHDSERGQSG